MRGAGLLGVLALALVASAAGAHEVRPGFLEIREVGTDTFDVLWKVPARGERRLALDVRLPDTCSEARHVARATGAAFVERWRASCAGGLVGDEITIDGLAATRTDVLVRIENADGRTQTVRLTSDRPRFTVARATGGAEVARTYFALGLEHILLGIDHLLFVLALLFLVGGIKRLVATVTAFTAAHSLTLAAATLGWVRVAPAPIEAAIALSIVFVASEIVRARRGAPSLTAARPWLVALGFGLLHGLGFAGALREVGLPDHAIPLALALFNLGVEAGQLLFVAAVLLLAQATSRLVRGGAADTWELAARAATPAAYGIGIVATYWLIDRTAGFWAQ